MARKACKNEVKWYKAYAKYDKAKDELVLSMSKLVLHFVSGEDKMNPLRQ